ncbi:lipocalin-like domain-containing protein [Gracilibacillus halophilus]|uniref:lipocalin-like domain-containing protein n=1 Tax=Gracilibacillus halophilus TaxID=470864 RepID=UPI0003AB350D|nr:glycoside hydrolase family 43 C-terminal domain-containing protein [Gracilibacillus halophilus]
MHIRKLIWTEKGWPVISPERFAGETNRHICSNELPGEWEVIQVDPLNDGQDQALRINLRESVWQHLSGNVYQLHDETYTMQVTVHEAWDWEQWKSTVVFESIHSDGVVYLAKKR